LLARVKVATFTDLSDVARLGLHGAVSWLPWSAEQRLARALVRAGGRNAGGLHTRVTRGLTDLLGTTRSGVEIAALADANIAFRWTERELVWLWRMAGSPRRRATLARDVAITGEEHLRAAVACGRGGLVLDAFLGRRVLAREALRQAGFALGQIHVQDHGGDHTWLGQRGLRRLHRRLSRRAGVDVVEIVPGSLSYLRGLVARLQRNAFFVTSGLGTAGDKFVAVEALGTTLAIPTGMLSLARTTGAALLPLVAYEDDAGRDHVVIESPLPPPEPGDAGLVAAARAYAAVLDRWVRRHPAQWFWWYAPPTPATVPGPARWLEG
jgi:lauroyl/myristoyl acyltransferase